MHCRQAVILLLLATAAPVTAQREPISDEPVRPRWALVPRLAVGSHGELWSGGENGAALGATNGPALGLALQFDPDGALSYELFGSFGAPEYEFQGPEDASDIGTLGSGSIRLLRLNGSVFYRIRENVPGYFILGAGALYYRPVDHMPGSYRSNDRAQWMPSAHVGLGYDLRRGGHTLQLDGRLYATRPTQSTLTVPILAQPLDAAVALDFLVSIGYRVGL